MIQIRPTRRHGVCNSCGRQQDAQTSITEVRTAIAPPGWTSIMLCEECVGEVQLHLF